MFHGYPLPVVPPLSGAPQGTVTTKEKEKPRRSCKECLSIASPFVYLANLHPYADGWYCPDCAKQAQTDHTSYMQNADSFWHHFLSPEVTTCFAMWREKRERNSAAKWTCQNGNSWSFSLLYSVYWVPSYTFTHSNSFISRAKCTRHDWVECCSFLQSSFYRVWCLAGKRRRRVGRNHTVSEFQMVGSLNFWVGFTMKIIFEPTIWKSFAVALYLCVSRCCVFFGAYTEFPMNLFILLVESTQYSGKYSSGTSSFHSCVLMFSVKTIYWSDHLKSIHFQLTDR